MKKKIIFFDIDGTLYDQKFHVPQSTQFAISQLIYNGHIPVLCTGRTKVMVPQDLIELGFQGIVAGAGTYVEYDERIIHNRIEGPEYTKDILPLLRENRIKYLIEGPECIYYDRLYTNEEDKYVKHIMHVLGKDKMKALDYDNFTMNKMSCSFEVANNIEVVLPKLEEKFSIIHHEGKNLLELVPPGYHKAIGIQKMIEYLGVDRSDTYAFGDSTNDLEMLEYVAYGIAMGNSYPEVLERAKYKTKSNIEDGIYYGLKEFGLI